MAPRSIRLPKSVPEAAADEANYGGDTLNEVKALWSKAQAMGKKRQLEYDNNGICEAFAYRGWKIRTHRRGLTKAGTEPTILCDSYFVAPSGKLFRSAKEIDRKFKQ